MMEKVTAGRDELGEFAPKFAQLRHQPGIRHTIHKFINLTL